MEFQIGQKVRIKPEFELIGDIKDRGKHYTITKVYDSYIEVYWQNNRSFLRKEQIIVVSVHIELERLEAAFYEYFENIHDNSDERNKEVQEMVEELMKVVKSVSINE